MSQINNTENVPCESCDETVISELTKDLESQLINNNDSVKENFQNSESSHSQCSSAVRIGDNEKNSGIPEDFEQEEPAQHESDDYIDEAQLKELEINLSEDELESRHNEALELKINGNEEHKNTNYLESIAIYTKALKTCPLKYKSDRSILYANRAASKARLDRKQSAIDDCSQALELNDTYVKAYLRRAKLYEETEKLDESLADYKKILTLDANNADALKAVYRLPPLIEERNEKLKAEMLGKLKDLGNMILKPFGLSTNNFQLNQDPNSGGYSVNFTQNSNN